VCAPSGDRHASGIIFSPVAVRVAGRASRRRHHHGRRATQCQFAEVHPDRRPSPDTGSTASTRQLLASSGAGCTLWAYDRVSTTWRSVAVRPTPFRRHHANQGLGHHHRAAPDHRPSTGYHRAVSRQHLRDIAGWRAQWAHPGPPVATAGREQEETTIRAQTLWVPTKPTLGQHPNREGRGPRTASPTRSHGTPAGYSQPLRRNPRYSPRQMRAITTSTTG